MKRIRISVLILCACFVSAAWGQRNGWREFHRPDMQRLNPYENVLNADNVGNLVLKWSDPTGNSVQSSPSVVNGVLYVGSNDNNVYALDATTGIKQWSYKTGGPITYSSPAAANGVIYVGSNDNKLYALNAKTGHKRWSYTAGAPVDHPPTVVNGVVYFGSLDSNVYALNANTGALLWKYLTEQNQYVGSSPQ